MTWRFSAGTCLSCRTNCPEQDQRHACAKQQNADINEHRRKMSFRYAQDKDGVVHSVPNVGERNYTGCIKRFERNHTGDMIAHPVLTGLLERGEVTCKVCLKQMEAKR